MILRLEGLRLLRSRRPAVAAVAVVFFLLLMLTGFYSLANNRPAIDSGGDIVSLPTLAPAGPNDQLESFVPERMDRTNDEENRTECQHRGERA